MDYDVVGYKMKRRYVAIPMRREVFNINFNRVWYSLDLLEMALHKSSRKLSGTVERYLMGLSSGG